MSFSKIKGGNNTPINALLIPNNLSDVANANTSLNNILPSQIGNANKALITDGSNTSWQFIQQYTYEITITQTSHGFAVDDYLIYDKLSSSWKRANSATDVSGAVGSVKTVVDANSFVLKAFGSIVDYTGVAGDYYYVDENGTGFLTNTQPLNRVQETLFALPNNKAIALNRHVQINLQNTVYVTLNGNDLTGNGSITKPYKTIQKAINASQPNSTIMIDTGFYTENLTITNGIHLVASSYRSVYVSGKVVINQTTFNNQVSFQGINFLNSTDNVIEYISTNSHELYMYECAITQGGTGSFNALYVTATSGNFFGKNLQTSVSISTGGSRAIKTSNTCVVNFTMFDCLTSVEDNPDNPCIELNGTGSFIYVGKNVSGQILAQGDGLTLFAFGGLSTNTVPILVTTQATQPCIITNANITTISNPCITGTGLFLYSNILFFGGSYLDYAGTLSGGGGAIALKSDNALSLRYRNTLTGLTATNIQDAIDEVYNSIGIRTLSVNQTAHGFSVNDNIMYDKTTSSWKLANSVGIYAIGSIARVKTVVDANNFILTASGNIINYTGLTAGEFYYVKDDGTGGLTLTPPTNVVQATLFALPSNKAIELQYPAVTPAPIPTGGISTGDILTSLSTSVTGYLLLDGALLSKTTYANLWTWVQANSANWLGVTANVFQDINASNFQLPDFRGMFLRNSGTNASFTKANGGFYSAALGSEYNDKFQGFNMTSLITPNALYPYSTGFPSSGTASYNANANIMDTFISDGVNGNPRTGDETNPVNIAVNYFIKY